MHLLPVNRTKNLLISTLILSAIIFGLTYTINASQNATDNTIPIDHSDGEDAIRVALLLDTSGSMSGLIEQAKSQLWNILNELNAYEVKGETPKILISLYEYGHDSYGSRNDFMQQILPFTTDMDLVSDKLFKFHTAGSKEYCGQVVYNSITDLNWGSNPNDLRLIYLAGNETIHQGRTSIAYACSEARERDISVSTIFCGDKYSGIELGWKQGADLCDGEFMYIDHNHETTYYDSPYDDDIQRLSNDLNRTFIPMGEIGKAAHENQLRQDDNAINYGSANAVSRANYKISKNYKSGSWDLVDAYEADKKVIKEKSKLPAEYEGLSDKEIEERIEEKIAERQAIKDQISDLNKKREVHIAEEKKSNAAEPSDLQQSILKSVEKVATKKDYRK
jgi:hypothetical protein